MLSIEEAKAKTMDLAIQIYRDGRTGLSKAAEIAGSSIAKFEDQLIKRGIGVILYAKDDLPILKSEIENIMEIAEKSRKTSAKRE